MIVKFYKCSNDVKEYPKNLTNEISIDCKLIEPINKDTPVLKFKYNSNLFDYQFAIIEEYGLTYIIEPNIIIRNGLMYMNLYVDAIQSFWNEIQDSTGHIVRSADSNESYIVDSMATQTSKIEMNVEKLGTAFTKGNSYVLIKGVANYKIIDED